MNPAQAFHAVTLGNHVGPIPNALLSAGVAGAAGYGLGAAYDAWLAPERSKNRPALWAALAAGAVGVPSFVGAAQRINNPANTATGMSRLFLDPWPNKRASAFGPIDTRPAPMTLHTAAHAILQDPTLTPVQRLHGLVILDKTPARGLSFSTADLIRGAAAAGLGYGAGRIAGAALSTIFGLPPSVQTAAAAAGAVGGVMRQAGIWK
jgi:hypothetical protein